MASRHFADASALRAAVRVGVWLVGGIVLAFGMRFTATLLISLGAGHRWVAHSLVWWPKWWLGGLAFIAIELAVHLVLQLRGKPNFYNGRG